MRDVVITLRGITEPYFQSLVMNFVNGNVKEVCRLILIHLRADVSRKTRKTSMDWKTIRGGPDEMSKDLHNEMKNIKTVGDLEKLWT